MLFSSNVFLFAYLPVVLFLYYISPRWLRNPVLLLFSLFFYGWGEPVYLFLMIGTIVMDYICGIWIHSCRERGKSGRGALVIGVALNLAILGYFKYAGFFLEQLQLLIPTIKNLNYQQIELPIGISFYVFQSMSYIIDVYRDDAPVQKKVLTFGTYVTLFPQLIAGPIVRYRDVAEQMENRKESITGFSSGVFLFIVGLSKKMLLANPMGDLWNMLQLQEGTLAAWVGIIAYSLQIYFDFSGYSDMARGLGRMVGFEFFENFNYPYISSNITEFWRRWHISLSTWFKEYVYIPLGGNRRGIARQILNILIVWLLTGFWHGASWNFIFWGLYYSILLIFEKLVFLKILKKIPAFFRHAYALIAIMLGWALFYFEDVSHLWSFIGKLFTIQHVTAEGLGLVVGYLPMLLISAAASLPVWNKLVRKYEHLPLIRWVMLAAAAGALLLCVAALASQSYNPFIYFRF